ncbi:MAG TPA: T9SS type A sorting domain-containing protein [Candidatus Kryptonia bacterium]
MKTSKRLLHLFLIWSRPGASARFMCANAMRLLNPFILSLGIPGLLVFSAEAQTTWSSSSGTITFTKSDYADWTQAANQDRITSDVWITRANNQAIFNIKSESSYDATHNTSPAGTEWAIGTTADIHSLTFSTWYNTVQSVGGPPSSVGKDMVVHLIADDVYIDIKFLSYTGGNKGGGFSYVRAAETPLPVQATGFKAISDIGSITISWRTESEVDNAGFVVMKQQSGISNWQLAGSYKADQNLEGLGTSSTGRNYSFTDNKVVSGRTYGYRVQSVSTSGVVKGLSTISVTVDVPKTFALYQNYPNPFNPETVISYQLSVASNVKLEVYNAIGVKVATLANGKQDAGVYDVTFDGAGFASGVYFYRIVAAGDGGQTFVSTKKLILMK